MVKPTKDNLYSNPIDQVAGFSFDQQVVDVFPDMINRSVPGYATVVAVSATLAERFCLPNTQIYDLGCSLGATSMAMAQATAGKDTQVIAVDNSPAMIDRLNDLIQASGLAPEKIVPTLDDVNQIDIHNASLVAMNFTLQFIPIEARLSLLQKVSSGLVDQGVLILSEKIQFSDERSEQLFVDLHHDFKRGNGYSDLEISQKRDALEHVLIPETIEAHRERLLAAGFSRVETWFQCFNFVSLVAFR